MSFGIPANGGSVPATAVPAPAIPAHGGACWSPRCSSWASWSSAGSCSPPSTATGSGTSPSDKTQAFTGRLDHRRPACSSASAGSWPPSCCSTCGSPTACAPRTGTSPRSRHRWSATGRSLEPYRTPVAIAIAVVFGLMTGLVGVRRVGRVQAVAQREAIRQHGRAVRPGRRLLRLHPAVAAVRGRLPVRHDDARADGGRRRALPVRR